MLLSKWLKVLDTRLKSDSVTLDKEQLHGREKKRREAGGKKKDSGNTEVFKDCSILLIHSQKKMKGVHLTNFHRSTTVNVFTLVLDIQAAHFLLRVPLLFFKLNYFELQDTSSWPISFPTYLLWNAEFRYLREQKKEENVMRAYSIISPN